MFSSLGRLLIREGYSASVMQVIYDRDEKRYGLMNRIFMGYPLHRAVYDRLHILTNRGSPDQTNFPGNSSFWDTVKYNPAFQGRQMRPDSLKFPVFI